MLKSNTKLCFILNELLYSLVTVTVPEHACPITHEITLPIFLVLNKAQAPVCRAWLIVSLSLYPHPSHVPICFYSITLFSNLTLPSPSVVSNSLLMINQMKSFCLLSSCISACQCPSGTPMPRLFMLEL